MIVDQAAIMSAILGLDRWFESMRVEWPSPGYGGPVVHWWNHSMAYNGAGFDWRYEGIIQGISQSLGANEPPGLAAQGFTSW